MGRIIPNPRDIFDAKYAIIKNCIIDVSRFDLIAITDGRLLAHRNGEIVYNVPIVDCELDIKKFEVIG